MRVLPAALVLLGACAAPGAPEPSAVASVPPPATREPAPSPFADLAARFQGVDLQGLTTGWPRRAALPKPEAFYGVALSQVNPAVCDGWSYDVLVDLSNTRIVWVRATGTIAGTVEYRGPAEVVGDLGPLELRIAE